MNRIIRTFKEIDPVWRLGIIVVLLYIFLEVVFILPKNYEIVTVTKIEQMQEVYSYGENSTSTDNYYLVFTDEGTFKVCIDGIFARPQLYGKIQVGNDYVFTTRGYSIPFFGIYPKIIAVE